MSDLTRLLTRISSFFRKEMVEIVRQPRLVLTLILGPFLILFLFGIGYRNQPRVVRAVFVAPATNELRGSIEEFATSLGPQLDFAGITEDPRRAINQLASGQVDMVVVPPSDVDVLIRNNQQAVFTLYHNEIDPAQISYIEYLGRNYIDELNRRVLSMYAQSAQQETSSMTPELRKAREDARQMREALELGNVEAARTHQRALNSDLAGVLSVVETRMALAQIIQSQVGQSESRSDLAAVLDELTLLQQDEVVQEDIPERNSSYSQEITRLRETEDRLGELESQLTEFQSISPSLLVSPFGTEARSITPVQDIEPATFFTPAVLALLLQHLAVTFGSLSIIRERLSGTMELFRVAPVSAGETVIGKYISYMVLGLILAAVLSALLYFILRMPVLGGWINFIAVTVVMLFASLGIGFIISLVAQNDSQAVQLAMISLLVSVFFSGMFLDLRYLWKPVQILSFLTPATYGTILYQDIMLRGYGITPLYFLGLVFIGLFLFLLSWRILGKEMQLG
jgi:ABC-2 type transport system permease protein